MWLKKPSLPLEEEAGGPKLFFTIIHVGHCRQVWNKSRRSVVACLRVALLHAFAMPFFLEFEDALNLQWIWDDPLPYSYLIERCMSFHWVVMTSIQAASGAKWKSCGGYGVTVSLFLGPYGSKCTDRSSVVVFQYVICLGLWTSEWLFTCGLTNDRPCSTDSLYIPFGASGLQQIQVIEILLALYLACDRLSLGARGARSSSGKPCQEGWWKKTNQPNGEVSCQVIPTCSKPTLSLEKPTSQLTNIFALGFRHLQTTNYLQRPSQLIKSSKACLPILGHLQSHLSHYVRGYSSVRLLRSFRSSKRLDHVTVFLCGG